MSTETKSMNSIEAYNAGFTHGVTHCVKYGIPEEKIDAIPRYSDIPRVAYDEPVYNFIAQCADAMMDYYNEPLYKVFGQWQFIIKK